MWPALVPRCIFQCSFMCCVDCDRWVLEMSLSLFSVHISSVIGYFGDPILQHYFQKKAQSQSVEMRGRLYRKKKFFFSWSISYHTLYYVEYLKILYCIRCLMCGFAFCNKLVGWSETFPNLIILFVYPAIYVVHIGKISCSMPLFRKLGSCNSVIWIKFTFRKLSAAISITNKLA